MKKFFGHLKTVIVHKHWVFFFARKFNIGWQGFWHDMSKFSPCEFFESVKYYSGTRSPIDACKEDNGYSMAWLHHKGRNKHHYEYWQDDFDKGTKHLDIPKKYVIEMLCDFLGAGKAYNKDATFSTEYDWWVHKKVTACAMNENQKRFFDKAFSYMYTHCGDRNLTSKEINWKVVSHAIDTIYNRTRSDKCQ